MMQDLNVQWLSDEKIEKAAWDFLVKKPWVAKNTAEEVI
jgi:hypothetical protein